MKKIVIQIIILLTFLSAIGISQNHLLSVEPYLFESKSGERIEAELCKFSVPENRSVANSKEITLHFVRFKSTNPNPGNPIIYLAGGPGGSGINTAKGGRFELFMALRSVSDVIAYDQRGTGLSDHVPACQETAVMPMKDPGVAEVYISNMANTAKRCLSYWKEQGVEIEGYNTQENANDLEDLRIALGVDKINLWGISYGSHLAFDFIKRYEESIDKVVLAGLEGPDHTIKQPKYNQNFLVNLQTRIQENEEAVKVYPNLLDMMQEVFNSLEKQPVTTTASDPRSGKTFEVGISKLDVQLVTSYFLTKNPKNSSQLPHLFLQMKNGNYSEIGNMVAMFRMYGGQIRAMPLIMDAMSGISEQRWNDILNQEKNSLLGRTTNFPYPDIAKDLDLPDLGDSFRENPISPVPVLFFSGTLDGRTYIESAKELAEGFQNGVHIILDGAGHDMFMSTPRVKELMIDFLKNNTIPSQTIDVNIPKFKINN